MSKKLINLTLPIVIEEIEGMLETYPHAPYREILSDPDRREELIAYVLSRVPNTYSVAEEIGENSFIESIPHFLARSLELRVQIESAIQQGIKRLLSGSSTLVARY